MSYMPVIGLEIHVQLSTRSKLFCPCSTDYIGATPNSNVCPVCLGLPGSLPVLNGLALRYALRIALALRCHVHRRTRFHRKNYFYPDLPKAYQISQYDVPLGYDGMFELRLENGMIRPIRIRRVHMEEDAGKLVHPTASGRIEGASYSLVDYNRSGVPLVEIVTEPDMNSPEEARDFVAALRQLVRFLGVSDGDMEKGSLRVDANVSTMLPDGKTSAKTEIKNLNSLRSLERALQHEFERQVKILEGGGSVKRETRHWDDRAGRTMSLRSKEEVEDYRYFPEPDLLPLLISDDMISSTSAEMPELPWVLEGRLMSSYGLTLKEARALGERREMASFFERVVAEGVSAERAYSWITVELRGLANAKGLEPWELGITPEGLASLAKMVDSGRISLLSAKDVLARMVETGRSAEDIVSELGLEQIGDEEALRGVALEVIAENEEAVSQFLAGKAGSLNFLVGQVMKRTRGKANPQLARAILERLLEERRR